MRIQNLTWKISLSVGLALAGAQAATAAGFVPLSKTGPTVLTNCNPTSSNGNDHCRVTSLPGIDGYQLVAARSAPLIVNDVTIGTVLEKVWRSTAHPKRYIFGTQLHMNANQWDASGTAFNVNDVFRQTLPHKKVAVAYFMDGATKALQLSGRTVQGLNESDGGQPDRDNTWVDFRIDANAAEPSGISSPKSPWLLTHTRAPAGIVLNSLGLRILNSDFADFFDAVDFFTASYQPDGVPPPGDDDDDD